MTQQAAMILPMIILVFFTFGMMLWMLKMRIRSVMQDGVDPRHFKLYKPTELPDYLLKVTHNFQNLLEMPPLFYIAIILLVALNITDTFYVVLSWAFLFSRFVHTYVHTTSNRLLLRRNIFIVSMSILWVLWVRVGISVISI